MNKEAKKYFFLGAILLVIFIFWTVAVSVLNVEAIGPEGSKVGLASINSFFHNLTGENLWMYNLTDFLSLIPLSIVAGFGILGLVQWIRRKKLLKVDFNILTLGIFYIVVLAIFVFFEIVVINYRPILIEGVLEASYPSSTTMLMMCIMPTAMMEFHRLIPNKPLSNALLIVSGLFTAFMVIFRLISGVHWLTDIIAGTILSAGLVMLYRAVCLLKKES